MIPSSLSISICFSFQSYFPGNIHVVYVLRPAGFFQKAISEVSSKFFKEDFKFRLMICSTLDDLFAHVERSQVTIDLGGELMYSHHEWIQQRIVSNCYVTTCMVGLKTIEQLNSLAIALPISNSSILIEVNLYQLQ